MGVAVAGACVSGSDVEVEPINLSEKNGELVWESALGDDQRFCYRNRMRFQFRPRQAWSNLQIRVSDNDDVLMNNLCLWVESDDSYFDALIQSKSAEERLAKREKQSSGENGFVAWMFHLVYARGFCDQTAVISPFGTTCFKVKGGGRGDADHSTKFRVTLKEKQIETQYPFTIFAGLALIYLGALFSGNWMFYYALGIILGFVFCLFFIVYPLTKRFFPKKAFWIATFFQGSMFGGIKLWVNLMNALAEQHPGFFYAILFGCFLFAFGSTHYMLRSEEGISLPGAGIRDLIKWGIQLAGYGVIAQGSGSVRWALVIVTTCFFGLHVFPTMSYCFSLFRLGRSAMRGRDQSENFTVYTPPSARSRKSHRSSARRYSNKSKGYFKTADYDLYKEATPLSTKYRASPYLSEEEYDKQAGFATKSAKTKLFKSPRFQKWLVENADRIHVEEDSDEGIMSGFESD